MWSTKPSQFDWRQCKQISGLVLEERKKRQQIELLSFVSSLVVNTKVITKENSLFTSVISLLLALPPIKLTRFRGLEFKFYPKKEEFPCKKLPQIVSKEVRLYW